ncbi:glycosyltransferase family 2 protein [Erythrobacter rubeus]|uniref:Glycosyltransferase family 2 protein n=1 Tax=Erythrobacter rubeus TaxID=2760803 RepID=A0ABR8KL06_9SPHN|nr:glycosyltransferase [Erythrobacter rubeus]MBD2841011.1 glycosyltransferase family 2 protein [Erythrobacter rubeus]
MQITVIVATLGRRAEADDLVEDLANQTRLPDRTIFAVTTEDDAPDRDSRIDNETLICTTKGLCAQRNAGLELAIGSSDIIVFFDDDFVPHPTYLARLEAAFDKSPDVVGMTGLVVADGVCGPGLTRVQAVSAISAHAEAYPTGYPRETDVNGLYGCNMAMRTSALGEKRFDERLPLYGWLEDLDLTNQLLGEGRLIKLDRLIGAHRGVKAGRVSGIRLGYSQIANARYLLAKGTTTRSQLYGHLVKYPMVNAVRSFRPEPFVDRRGRLRGNLIGLFDLALGKSKPEKILEL